MQQKAIQRARWVTAAASETRHRKLETRPAGLAAVASLLVFLVSCLQPPVSRADVPRLIHYQGKLVTSTGAIVPGPVSIRARLYDGPTTLTPVLFDETHAAVALSRGLFSILLGSQTGGGVPDSVLANAAVYLGVAVDGAAELGPRIRIATAPYAARTKSSEQLVRPGTVQPGVVLDGLGRVGMGTTSPDSSAALDIASTTGGLLMPRLTAAQRDAIAGPATGLQIFNLDNNCIEFYIGGLWQSLVCGCSAPPAAPLVIAGPEEVCEDDDNVAYSITPVFGATGYTWSVPPDATIAAGDGTPSITVDFGSASGSIIVSAGNACGSSADRALPITVKPLPDPSFTQSPPQVYEGGPVQFTPAVSGATYSWTFEDGSPPISSAENPTVTWVTPGTYEVSLIVTASGCSDSSTQSITVSAALASCAAILSASPGTPDGLYSINPDGPGGIPAFATYCDMTTDGGGWTIVTAYAAATGQPGLTSSTEVAGNALAYQTFNVSAAKKELISAMSTQSLFRRSDGPWLRVNQALFDDNLTGAGNQHSHYSVTVTADNGASASNCQMGYSNFNINEGGDFGITTSGNTFDHHGSSYYHLNGGCSNMFLFHHGTTYNVNTALGSWNVTMSCGADNASMGGWYAAMR